MPPPEAPASVPSADLAPDDRVKLDELAAALDGFAGARQEPTFNSPPSASPALASPPAEAVSEAPAQQPVPDDLPPPASPAQPEEAPPAATLPGGTLPADTPAAADLAAAPAVPAPAPPAVASAPPAPAQSLPTSSNAMIPWIETKQFAVDLFPSWTKTEGDKEWSLGAVTANVPDIVARLDQIIASLNEDQWEIKLVVPLDKSLTYHEHQKVVRQGSRREPEAVLGAFGLGWAAGTTSSLLIVCQRTEWLEAADYRARIDARNARLASAVREKDRAAAIEHNNAVNARITAAQALLDDLKTNGVQVKKSGFLRSEKFVVDGAEFTNRTEAESAMRARIGELEADLAALPRQLKTV